MAIKKDGSGKRWVEMELVVPGTPEQVWHALATGPGYAAWFAKSKIEPRAGGELLFDFGEGSVSKGEVTAWEPHHRFEYVEREWEPGAPPVATEITITSRSGDRCVIRMVHSLFTSSDAWDDQVEGFESGWPGFFAVLRVYLARFPLAKATSFVANVPANAGSLPAWQRLTQALGLAGASVGERRSTTTGPEPWSGVVEHVHQDAQQRYVVFRIEEPASGVALVGTYDKGAASPDGSKASSVSVSRYYYGDEAIARAAESEARWRAWLAETFGPQGAR
jgi:uncharacterized protein YndB with AHSA1/START domain